MQRRSLLSTLSICVTVTAAAMAVACGGGGGSGGTPPIIPGGLTASFAAENSSPGADSIHMGPGTANGDTFEVQVLVTGVDDFFGAAFRVLFDPSVAQYQSFSSNGTFIGGATTDFNVSQGGGGELIVNATRIGQVAGVDSGSGALLMTMTFKATQAVSNSAFSFGVPQTVQECPPGNPLPACVMVGANWFDGSLSAN